MRLKNRAAAQLGIVGEGAGLEFRISILNFTMHVAAIFSLMFTLLHLVGINDLGPVHSQVIFVYSLLSFGLILLIRRSHDWFNVVAPVFVGVSILCFTSALIFVTGDEFRQIWFYFVIYVTYVLLSDRAGLIVTALCILIVLICAATVELELSSVALLTGTIGMLIISLLSRTYTMQIVGYESLLEDKNRRLQQSIKELDGALASAWEANQTKNLFLANMSHEIRTPMNGVLGMVQVMKGTSLDDNQMHYLNAIDRAGKNLLVLIDDLLDISRIESGKLDVEHKPFSTFDWVMDVQFNTEPLFEQGPVIYTTEVSEQLPKWLMGDSSRLTQIATNLVSNAAKFTSSGEVRLIVNGEPLNAEYFNLHVEVVDTGIGIPEEHRKYIFEPFEQVNPERIINKGVGLGLAISKGLANAMDGSLSVESKRGQGSCFCLDVMLPVVNHVNDTEDVDDKKWRSRRLRVLITDDDAINRLTVRTLLSQQGHEVMEAEDGEQAVEHVHQGHFDVVLMDVHMPKMDGVTATKVIRSDEEQKLAQIPIIGLTASVMSDEKERYLRAGMSAVVQKPIVLEQLLATINEHLND